MLYEVLYYGNLPEELYGLIENFNEFSGSNNKNRVINRNLN